MTTAAPRRPGRGARTELRWWLGRHRRLVAGVLAALAVWAGVSAARVRPAAGVAVLAAAHDLATGATLSSADLDVVRLPAAAVPAGALRPGDVVTGRVLSGALRRGEPLTDVRLALGLLLPAGTEAVPIRLSDAGAAAVAVAGDHIDVLATAGVDTASIAAAGAGTTPTPTASASSTPAATAPAATLVAAGLVVLLAPAAASGSSGLLSSGDGSASDSGGGLLVVAATPAQAADLAGAAAVDELSITVVATGSAPPGS